MLQASHRLCARRDIEQVFKKGVVFHTRYVTVRVFFSLFPHSRGTVVVSNKISKKAVVRNRIKRWLRPVMRNVFSLCPKSMDMIISAKSPAVESDARVLRESVFVTYDQVVDTQKHSIVSKNTVT